MSLSKRGVRNFMLLAGMLLMANLGKTQELIDWEILSQVEFESKYYEEVDEYLWFPTFSSTIKNLEGKRVQITGHIIPVDLETGLFVLSAYPYSACFFCGNAGPESVMSLKFNEKPRRYELDEVATFQGVLKLNDSDVDEMNYILEQAVEK